MTQDMHALAVKSVEHNLSPKELINLYREAGFKKNARGKAWTVSAAYQHQLKVRKAMPKPQKNVDFTDLKEQFKRELIEQVLNNDDWASETKLKEIEDIYAGKRTSFRTLTFDFENFADQFILKLDDDIDGRSANLHLDRSHAKVILAHIEQLQKFVDEGN